jgi:hypothetical protein
MKIQSLTILLALGLGGAAFAADPAKPKAAPAHPMQAMGHGKMAMAAKTPAERQKMFDDMFVMIDTDKNGTISKAEFNAHHQAMMSMHHDGQMMGCPGAMMMGQGGAHGPMAGGMMSDEHYKMELETFKGFDKNHDGSVSKAEFPSGHPMLMHYDMLDANKDGRVTEAEFAAHHGK